MTRTNLFSGAVAAFAAFSLITNMTACGDSGSSSSGSSGGSSGSTGGSTGSTGSQGAGAALKCTSSGKNAFDTFGAAAFVAVNESIFTNVTSDTSGNLGTSFGQIGKGAAGTPTADDLPTFKGKLAAFLVYTYGGPTSVTYTDNKTYVGNTVDLQAAHTGMAITADQYTYFVNSIVVPALTTNHVTVDDVNSCFAPVLLDAGVKAAIIGH